MRTVTLLNGDTVPALGLGTWGMGEQRTRKAAEVKALQLGLDLGLSLIDTAEMYGEGGAEEVVAEAIAGRRDSVYVVSKVYPHNASATGAIAACERSLRRLKTDTLDLYLLHWRGNIPFDETIGAFEKLKRDGKIRAWGVSNLDDDDMAELLEGAPQDACLTDQVLYHLGERGIEWSLLPASQQQGIAIMAYSPLGQGELLGNAALRKVAAKHEVSPATAALAWVLRQKLVIAIPKASDLDHVRANATAANLVLDDQDLADLDKAFQPPKGPSRLAML